MPSLPLWARKCFNAVVSSSRRLFGTLCLIRSVYLFVVPKQEGTLGNVIDSIQRENSLARLHIAIAGVELSWRWLRLNPSLKRQKIGGHCPDQVNLPV